MIKTKFEFQRLKQSKTVLLYCYSFKTSENFKLYLTLKIDFELKFLHFLIVCSVWYNRHPLILILLYKINNQREKLHYYNDFWAKIGFNLLTSVLFDTHTAQMLQRKQIWFPSKGYLLYILKKTQICADTKSYRLDKILKGHKQGSSSKKRVWSKKILTWLVICRPSYS